MQKRQRTFEQLEPRHLCTVSPFDVTGDGVITPADVVAEIGNANSGHAVPLDVLRIINHINAYGSNTPGEYPIVGTLPAGDTLGRIQYDATRPTAVEIAVFAQGTSAFPEIENPVLVDSDGNETFGVRSQPGSSLPRWVFRPVVDGAGVLTLRGTVEIPVTIWGMTTFWDTVANRPMARGLELSRLV